MIYFLNRIFKGFMDNEYFFCAICMIRFVYEWCVPASWILKDFPTLQKILWRNLVYLWTYFPLYCVNKIISFNINYRFGKNHKSTISCGLIVVMKKLVDEYVRAQKKYFILHFPKKIISIVFCFSFLKGFYLPSAFHIYDKTPPSLFHLPAFRVSFVERLSVAIL